MSPAIAFSAFGVAFSIVIIAMLGLWLRSRELEHLFISDHDFVAWVDVFHVGGRRIGDEQLGQVKRCHRALVGGIAVELLRAASARGLQASLRLLCRLVPALTISEPGT